MAPTVGEQLKAAREQRHLSLEEAVSNTHIRLQFLKALEENHLDELASKAQARGFIRLYASFLGIPIQPLLDALEEKPPLEPALAPEDVEQPSSAQTIEETPSAQYEEILGSEEEAIPEFAPIVEPDYQTIYREIGLQLRQRREALSLSLDDISLHTRLKKNVLEILEEGQFDSLPSPVQARGLLNNYAKFLNLDVEVLLLHFAEALQLKRVIQPKPVVQLKRSTPKAEAAKPIASTIVPTVLSTFQNKTSEWVAALSKKLHPLTDKVQAAVSRIRPVSQKASPIAPPIKPSANQTEPLVAKVKLPDSWRRFITPDLITGAFLILILFGFLFWAVTQLVNWQASLPNATPSPVADILLATQTITGTPGAASSPQATNLSVPTTAANGGLAVNATIAATLPAGPTLPVQISIIANQRAYLDIKTDGNEKFTGRVLPGNAYEFGAYKSIELTTGNGAALRVIYNQQDLGIVGNFGQDVHLIFTQQGMATPTPAASPTATRTPTPTITLPATLTLQPSPTAPTPTVTPYVP
ncbi:MAG: RodZ domain-containing protein [Anaerolineaceae bacterium]|jgi:cytoskeletal protein RodZ